MSLETDTVDTGTRGLHETDQPVGCGGLGAGVLDAVVVVVQLGGRVCCCGCGKGYGDICFSYGLVEDVGTVGSVVVESCSLLAAVLYTLVVQGGTWTHPR